MNSADALASQDIGQAIQDLTDAYCGGKLRVPPKAWGAAELERFGVASHEAGHAVAMCVLRRPFLSVSIIPDGESSGRVMPGPWAQSCGVQGYETRTRLAVERAVMTLYAGPIAQARCGGGSTRTGFWRPSCDQSEARDLLARLVQSGDELMTYASWLWCRTETLLAEPANHAAIQALAMALMESPTIGARKARSIIGEARESYKKEAEK